jgi:hypothetical protein
MDDEFEDFTELEAELRELRPLALSNDLIRRVDKALAKPISSPLGVTTHGVFEWLAWPIAASFVGAVAWLSNGAVSGTKNPEAAEKAAVAANYKPVGTENILYDVREEGLTTLADGTPAKQIRDRYMDIITWKNATASSSVRWTVPRDEIRLVPVEAY